MRSTKIIATLGPATDAPQVLARIFTAGVNVVRINFSHGSAEDREKRVAEVRRVSAELGLDVAILGDLQGPKIRVEKFADGPIELIEGEQFSLDPELGEFDGDQNQVGITYAPLAEDVSEGDVLLLDDGQIELLVTEVKGKRVVCRVVVGGKLSDNKGMNRQGGGLSAPALTEKDLEDIQAAAAMQLDFLAVSFPRSAADIENARRLLHDAGGSGLIVAKIERAEAVEDLENIVEASDVIMIARGDLGVEMGFSSVPGIQKRILAMTRKRNKLSITATQMMESMITQPLPTRAEVSDVANAVLDGTDAVMLSAETAVGKRPVAVVSAMAKVCEEAERHQANRGLKRVAREDDFLVIDEAIAMAAMYTANHLSVKAIVALTESGATARWMSRIRTDIPIFAFTRRDETRRRVQMYRGVYPVQFDVVNENSQELYQEAFKELIGRSAVASGDLVIFTKGDMKGVTGGTNAMKILEVS
ncbi:MAG: pyruvate kinase [Chromatiales bacterium]|nr:pyruvate kinase [Chromatiales bacterium]